MARPTARSLLLLLLCLSAWAAVASTVRRHPAGAAPRSRRSIISVPSHAAARIYRPRGDQPWPAQSAVGYDGVCRPLFQESYEEDEGGGGGARGQAQDGGVDGGYRPAPIPRPVKRDDIHVKLLRLIAVTVKGIFFGRAPIEMYTRKN